MKPTDLHSGIGNTYELGPGEVREHPPMLAPKLLITVSERADDRIRVDIEDAGGDFNLSFVVDDVAYKDARPRKRPPKAKAK